MRGWAAPIGVHQESDDAVAQLYGPSILPGSRVGGGFHIFLSQWQNPGVWPYHVMQFKIPMPGARALRELPPEGRRRKAPPKKAQPRKATPEKKTPAKTARVRKASARTTATKRTRGKAKGDS